MPGGDAQRRLSAILSADIAGYSRLMAEDEEATIRALGEARKIVSEAVTGHEGRIVDFTGDNFLAEFASAVNAARAALALQEKLGLWNESSPAERRMHFRIGAHLGDVRVEGERIFGTGVNIAARLESLAEPGGVCISRTLLDEIEGRVPFVDEDLGEHVVKNIPRPVHAYRIGSPGAEGHPKEPASRTRRADPAGFDARPSLLVAPFRPLGSDELSRTLAEALTEGIANALTRFEEHAIVDPGAATHADASPTLDLGRQLGASWLLDGRVQAAQRRVRITAQIVEVETGRRKWSDTFDREADDLFALQDELAAVVASTVGEALHQMTSEALGRKPQASWGSVDYLMRGIDHLHLIDPAENARARECFDEALSRDPELPLAIVSKCWTYYFEVAMGWPRSRDDGLAYCIETLRQLLVRHERTAHGHRLLARSLHVAGEHAEALKHSERAYELNPYDTDMIMNLSLSLSAAGDAARAVELAERAVRINPYGPPTFPAHLSLAYLVAGRHDDVLRTVEAMRRPVANADLYRVASLMLLGEEGRGREAMQKVLEERPQLTREIVEKATMLAHGPHRERYLDALARAGLPVSP